MIKQIQLRGISHRPSDRMTADGGLEECIDLRLEEQEQVPATAPNNVTESLAPGLSSAGIDVTFIHKTNNYTNYVGSKAYTESEQSVLYLVAYIYNPGTSTWGIQQVQKIGDSSIVSITSIGNMLIYSLSDGKTYYALFKGTSYLALGDSLPRPEVTFAITNHSENAERLYVPVTSLYNSAESAYSGQDVDASLFWQYVMQTRGGTGGYENTDSDVFYNGLMEDFWSEDVNERRKGLLEDGKFSAPVLVRYALKMRDGSYVNVSEPIILTGVAKNQFVEKLLVNIGTVDSSEQGILHYFIFEWLLSNVFSASVSVELQNASDWSELISSVDVFVSTDIITPKLRCDFSATAESQDTTMTDSTLTMEGHDAKIGFDIENEVDDFEEKMLEKGNFYLLKSFPLNELPASYEPLKPVAQDDLVVSQRLESPQSHSICAAGKLGSYNNRLVSGEQDIILSSGHGDPQALLPLNGSNTKKYTIVYFVRDDAGREKIVYGYSQNRYPGQLLGFVSYPDARCFKAALYVDFVGATTIYSLPMKEHPRLDAAYGFWGLDDTLDNAIEGDGREEVEFHQIIPPPEENKSYSVQNRLALSEMDNPFVFPLGQRIRFTAEIVDSIPITTALSSGQFGQFPLYVFTKDGIYSVSLNDEGGLAASHPLSRDVAIEGSVAQLDQAVVFVSSSGVMLVSGSEITKLSPFMDGPRYTISEIAPIGSALRNALITDGFGDLLTISLDTTNFQSFMAGSSPCYDYANKRILFFKNGKNYAYDYSLVSQTWHRLTIPSAFVRVLNGYPDALVLFNGGIYDFSVHANFASTTARKGFILTRPFDLGEPDIRKSVNSIRVRGSFNKNDVKYILLGSMDGLTWKQLTSLRGGSYKFFRILLLSNLTPGERVSWVDIDYDSRFTNKLR